MADETTETVEAAPVAPAETFDAAYVEKLRKEAAKYRTQVKELEPLAQRARELEDGAKTETEKLTEKTRVLEERARMAELDAIRLRVALRHGLTESQSRRLAGATEEELDEDALAYLEEVGVKADEEEEEPVAEPTVPERSPHERLRPGRKGTDPLPLNGDPLVKALQRKLGVR